MSRNPVRNALRPLSFAQVRGVSPVRGGDAGDADGRIERIYREMERVFGVISPPVALHSPAPDALCACWLMLYETLLVAGPVERTVKEAVATAVSVGNECPYCVTVHGTMMRGLGQNGEADAIARDHVSDVPDPRVRAIVAWARANAQAGTGGGREAPFPAGQAAEIVGVALTFQYFNRMVNAFLPEAPLPPGVPARALTVVLPVLSRLMQGAYRRTARPGACLDLLPDAELRPELWWAAGNPGVAQALSRAGAAIEAGAERSVPAEIRELVRAELAAWDGRPKGVSRAWAEDAARAVPDGQRAAARLALLVAFASYQVDDAVLAAAGGDGHAAVIELASWAAYNAAVRTTGWMSIPGRDDMRSGEPATE